MTDISVLTNIALFHLYAMTFLLFLVIIYAIAVMLYFVVMLVKKKGITLHNPLKDTVDETISTMPKDIETTGGKVVKLVSPEQRRKLREKRRKRELGLK